MSGSSPGKHFFWGPSLPWIQPPPLFTALHIPLNPLRAFHAGQSWSSPLDVTIPLICSPPHTYVCINTQLWRWPIFQLQNTVSIRGFCQLWKDMNQRGAEGTAVSALLRGSACQVHRCSNYPGTIWPTVMENILEIEISQQEKVFNQLATVGQSKTSRFYWSLFSLFLLCFSPQHLQYCLPDTLGNCWKMEELIG